MFEDVYFTVHTTFLLSVLPARHTNKLIPLILQSQTLKSHSVVYTNIKYCFSGNTSPTLEAGDSLFFFINSVGKSSGNHKQECKVQANMQVMHSMHSQVRAQRAQEKLHLPICACVLGDLELINKEKKQTEVC